MKSPVGVRRAYGTLKCDFELADCFAVFDKGRITEHMQIFAKPRKFGGGRLLLSSACQVPLEHTNSNVSHLMLSSMSPYHQLFHSHIA